MNFRKRIKSAKRIVIKVGSSMVTYKNGHINLERIDNLSRAISSSTAMRLRKPTSARARKW